MTDDILDPIAEDAARALSDQLGTMLVDTVDGAATRALGRIQDELQRRAGQIDEATSRAAELIDTIGDEMRTRALAALAEGVRTQVVPALARDEEKLRSVISKMDHAIQKEFTDTRTAVLHAADALAAQHAAGTTQQTRSAEHVVRELQKQYEFLTTRLEMRFRTLFRFSIALGVVTGLTLLLLIVHMS